MITNKEWGIIVELIAFSTSCASNIDASEKGLAEAERREVDKKAEIMATALTLTCKNHLKQHFNINADLTR